MISSRMTRPRARLLSEARASQRIFDATANELRRQLKGRVHPLISLGDVDRVCQIISELQTIATELCKRMRESTLEDEAAIRSVLGTDDGARLGQRYIRLDRELQARTVRWDDNVLPGRVQLEFAEPTDLTLRHRATAHLMTALYRQAEAQEELIHAEFPLHYLQFWFWPGDEFHYAGEEEEASNG